MPNVPAAPATLSALQAVQALLLSNVLIGGVSPFAALTSADATRYGVARAVFVGAPKDYRDSYLPQCQIAPDSDAVLRQGAQGRARDELLIRLTCIVDYTDWWQAEQTILKLRDAVWPVLLVHVRSGTNPGTSLVALELPEITPSHSPTFATLLAAGVWYRTWTCHILARQVWAATGGLQV